MQTLSNSKKAQYCCMIVGVVVYLYRMSEGKAATVYPLIFCQGKILRNNVI